MTSLDKAGMAIAIAITAIFIGIAATMGAVQDTPTNTTPTDYAPTVPTKTQTEQFGADIAEKVKSGEDVMKEEAVVLEEKITIEVNNEKETTMDKPTGPTTHSVDIPSGTSVPGCEESNSCFSPADITVNAGDTVEWINIDTAAHTVTAGSPADVQIEIFDSSLLMGGGTWSFTFDEAGSYDYFCMVHPWMTGSVTVN
jgi:plastocyanin